MNLNKILDSLNDKIKEIIPLFLLYYLRRLKIFIGSLPYVGEGRYCPVCGKSSKRFEECGRPPRKDALCMRCKSKERDRLACLYFNRMTDLFDGQERDMLHIAPEHGLAKQLRKRLGRSYLTADLCKREVMVKMDITNIQFADDSFDVIYCSHVLEHVPDDKQAIREFYRVLKSKGYAIITVPIEGEKTFEDNNITDPVDRFKIFGQEDHVRQYGFDVIERLREGNFDVTCIRPADFLSEQEILNMAITDAAGELFLCKKL